MQTIYKLSFTALLLTLIFTAKAQTTDYKAYSVFLYSFTKYIEWPVDTQEEDFLIAVYGNAAIVSELQASLAGRKVGTRPIKIIEAKSTVELAGVHMIFVSDAKSGSIDEIVTACKNKPMFIVTERNGLIKKGACLSFMVTTENQLKFELNDTVMKERGLKMSSTLTNMALKKA